MDREVCFISGAGNLGEGQRPISSPTDNQCGRSPSRLRREGLLEDGADRRLQMGPLGCFKCS